MKSLRLRGQIFYTHENEDLSNHIHREQDFFEAEILDFIRDNYPVHHTIIDAGANIGNHTVYFARFLKYVNILAFEPIDANWNILLQNVAPYSGIYCYKNALDESEGMIPMTANTNNMGMSGYDSNSRTLVPAYALDSYFITKPTMLKLDVENFEPRVLAGAKRLINRFHPLIVIEDNFNQYEPLLPGYKLVRGWEISKTYIYEYPKKRAKR